MDSPIFWVLAIGGNTIFLGYIFWKHLLNQNWVCVPIKMHANTRNDRDLHFICGGGFDTRIVSVQPFNSSYAVFRNKHQVLRKNTIGQENEFFVSDLIWILLTTEFKEICGWCRTDSGLHLFKVQWNRAHTNEIFIQIIDTEHIQHDTFVAVREAKDKHVPRRKSRV